MKLCLWRKNFTNRSKVSVEVGPFSADFWKHNASGLPGWYEQILCSLKMQVAVKTQTLPVTYSLGSMMPELWSLADFVPHDFTPAHSNPSGPSPPGHLHIHASWALYWYIQTTPACMILSAFQDRVGFFLFFLIECSPRQQLVSCQSKDKVA